MNIGKCQRLNDRPVNYGEMRHIYSVVEGLSSWRFPGHTIHEKRTDRRNCTNETNNLRDCKRMKGKLTISWKGNYQINHWDNLDWKHERISH